MEVLRYGSTGAEVLLLQLALKRGRYYWGELDGIFGTRTLNAVRRFQTARGLAPDGVAGPLTFASLEPWLLGALKVVLRPGDTFFKLARRYGTSTEAVLAANPGLEPTALPVGTEVTVPLGFDLVPCGVPFSSKLTEYAVRGLALRYPFISAGSIGSSVLGKSIASLEMGSGERRVFLSAAYHANEWITTPLALSFIEGYSKAYITGGSIGGIEASALFERARLFAVPLVNPDGVDLVTGALPISSAAYRGAVAIAEDYPGIPFPEGWKANIAGTDINLNFPADWELAREIKFALGFTGPAPRDYVGSSPLSAPEARAVYDHTVNNDFDLVLAYHTQGEVIFWRYKDIEPAGAEDIAERLAEVSGYALENVPDESANAGYRDWFILQYDRPGYTVEAGRGANPLPVEQLAEIKSANFPLIAEALALV